MKEGFNSYKFFNMLGGINSSAADTAVGENQVADMMNMTLMSVGNYGRLDKRKGRSKYVALQPNGANTIQGMYDFIRREDNKKRFMAVSGGNVYWDKGGTWTSIQTGLSSTEKFSFTEYINYVLWSNKTDGLYKWDGITAPAQVTAAPEFKGIKMFKNHVFGFGVEEYPYTLYWSELQDIDTYPATNIINFDENITAIGVLPNVLAVFTQNTFAYITGSDNDDFARHYLNANVGCVAQFSLQEVDKEIFFLAKDGVYKANMAGEYTKLSMNIDDKIASINPAVYDACWSVHDKLNHRYILAVPIKPSTTNTRLFIYDYMFDAWTVEDHCCACLELSEELDGSFKIISGGYNGYIYKHYDTGNDDGTAIDAWIETKWIDFGDPSQLHTVKWLKVYYNAVGEHDLDAYIYTDGDNNDPIEKTFYMRGGKKQLGVNWNLDVDELYGDAMSIEVLPIYCRCNTIKVKLQQNGDNEKMQLYGIELLEVPIGVGISGDSQS